MPWGAVIGLAGSYLMGKQQKKANQASINAMSDIANRPQRTGLGSFFTPGGTSSLAPYIQNTRADISAGFPGYKSTLQGSTNTFLRNLGGIRNELTGGGPTGGGFYQPIQMDPTAMFGTRPDVGSMPVLQNYLSGGEAIYGQWKPGSWGYAPPRTPTGYTPQAFDATGFANDMSQYQSAVDAQRQYDQNVANYQAQVAAGAPTGAPGTPAGGGNGLHSDFMQAALRPIREAGAQQYAAQERDIGRRGIGGSSLGYNQLRQTKEGTAQQLADTTTKVRQQQLAQVMGIDEAALNAATGLVNNLTNLDMGMLNQIAGIADEELRILGLHGANLQAAMQPIQMAMQNNSQYYGTLARGMMGAGDMLSNDNNALASLAKLFNTKQTANTGLDFG